MLALPLETFRTVHTLFDLVGGAVADLPILDINKTNGSQPVANGSILWKSVPDEPYQATWQLARFEDEDGLSQASLSEDEEDLMEDLNLGDELPDFLGEQEAVDLLMQTGDYVVITALPDTIEHDEADSPVRESSNYYRQEAYSERNQIAGDADLSMTYIPHIGLVAEKGPWSFNPDEPSRSLDILINDLPPSDTILSGDYAMLRAYEHGFDLRRLAGQPSGDLSDNPNDNGRNAGDQELAMFWSDAMRSLLRPSDSEQTWSQFRMARRINMVIHVPELQIVFLGSPEGRVLIVTTTRLARPMADPHRDAIWDYALRPEWVLPRASEEAKHIPVRRPLYGMAVGPVPCLGSDRKHKARLKGSMPPRYRLMLHYRNHDVLSYELWREEHTERLCIF